jgi:hypothetical protein
MIREVLKFESQKLEFFRGGWNPKEVNLKKKNENRPCMYATLLSFGHHNCHRVVLRGVFREIGMSSIFGSDYSQGLGLLWRIPISFHCLFFVLLRLNGVDTNLFFLKIQPLRSCWEVYEKKLSKRVK